jgi:DNA invertase Pin-like site-specific DNA recombinase
MPPRKTTKKVAADATDATQSDGRGARRIPGGANQGEGDVARHASPGARAPDRPGPRGQDEIGAGSQGPRGGRPRSAAAAGPSANGDTPPGVGQRIGYARVSTRQQDLTLQLDALDLAGCARIFKDVGSGTIRKRPQLEACLDYVRAGDTLVVWRLDRLGRSLRHLVDVVAQLEQRHVAFESLREKIDTTTAGGKLQLHIFAALAEFERELIRERSQAGREVAKAAGRLGGRPLKLTPEKRGAALAMRERGEMTMSQIARALGVGRTTLYDHLGELPPLDGIPRPSDDEPAA